MNAFNVIIPLQKDLNGGILTGIASTTSVDRDDERMSDTALQMMVDDIKKAGVNLFGNHEHSWENTLGVIKDAELVDKQVRVKIQLDDASTNPKVAMLLNKLKKGIMLGLSVGGNVEHFESEYSRQKGKKIRVLDRVKIYEVSVVGIPANADSYLSLGQAIAKSAKLPGDKCSLCFTKSSSDKCPTCLAEKRD
jgi:HK97 family phage prohead protease